VEKNTVRTGLATVDNMAHARCMLDNYVRLQMHTMHTKYFLVIQSNNSYANGPQYDVKRTLAVLKDL
jgi:hypothetical protein